MIFEHYSLSRLPCFRQMLHGADSFILGGCVHGL